MYIPIITFFKYNTCILYRVCTVPSFFRYFTGSIFPSICPAGFNQNCNVNCEFKHNNITPLKICRSGLQLLDCSSMSTL